MIEDLLIDLEPTIMTYGYELMTHPREDTPNRLE